MKSNLQKLVYLFLMTLLFATAEVNAQIDIEPPEKDEDKTATIGVFAPNSDTKEIVVLNQHQQVVTIIKTKIGLADPSILAALPKGIYLLRREGQQLEIRK